MILSVLFLIIPVVVAFLVPLFSIFARQFGKYISVIIYLMGIVIGIILYPEILSQPITQNLGGWDSAYAINLYLSPLSLAGGILIYSIAFLINIYDISKERKAYYNLLFNLFIFANLGIIMTADLFNMLVLMEIGSISAIALIAKGSMKEGSIGSFKYIIISSITAMLMLACIGLLYSAVGTLNIASISESSVILNSSFALLIGIGLLMGLMYHSELFPFNGWVPSAYNGSRYSFASAMAGIGGTAGVLLLGRVIMVLFNGKTSAFPSITDDKLMFILFGAGIISVLIGEIGALRQYNIKRMLAFSSIAQMGLVAIAFSIGSFELISAGLMVIFSHSIAKVLLLLIAGHFANVTNNDDWRGMKGVAISYPLLGVLFIVGSLSLMGIPLFMGFWGKIGVLLNVLGSTAEVTGYITIAVIVLSSIIEGIYLMRVSHSFFIKSEKHFIKENGLIISLIGLLLGAVILIIGIYPDLISNLIDNITLDLTDYQDYIRHILGIVQ